MPVGTLAFSSVGSKISISAAAPATIDSAGFVALTWTQIHELDNIGVIGGETAILEHMPVDVNTKYKLKGSKDPGALALSGAYAPTDPGQVLLEAGEAGQTPVSVKLELQNGKTFYSQALITSFKVNVGGQSQITKMESNCALTGLLVKVAMV